MTSIAACGDDDDGGTSSGSNGSGGGEGIKIGLITKTETNPFFVSMKEGAQKKAAQLGVELRSFSGKNDVDNESQVAAVENLIAAGAKGFLITPANSKAIVPALDKARQAGLIVIALDTLTDPPDAADVTFATDNFKAGVLIGRWARGKLESEGKDPADARIAMLDVNADQISTDVQRNQGFLKGFGIDLGDPTVHSDEDDPRIVGHGASLGAEAEGRTAMENLLQKNPNINLVYAVNEAAAFGAIEAIKAAGKTKDIMLMAIDGSCPGLKAVRKGTILADSQQYPLRMAELGVQTIVDVAKSGKELPKPPSGKAFINTGTTLVTDDPVEGVPSKDIGFGLDNCWG